MKTFIPHVYFSAPEDTVGDLVNQIRRESEIPGTAEPKPEMKDSGKKSIIPKTVVSAPEKDTVGDLIEQLHKEPEALPEEKPEEKTEQPEKTEGKKSIIPKTVVSAAKSELDRVYDLLTSGEDLQMNPDGTLSPASAPKKRAKPAPGSEPKAPVKTKKEIIPHTVVSAPEKDTVGDLIEQLHKEPEALPEEKPEEKTEQPEKTEGKKSIIPKTVVSAAKSELDRVYDLLTSGEDLQMNPDGTLSPASAPKKRAKPAPGSEPKAPVKTKKEIIPHTVVSAPVQQWYKTNKALYNAEIAAMRKEFNDPNMQPHFMSDGRMYWLVKTRPNLGRGFNTMTYTMKLVYDPDHPKVRYSSSVKPYLVSPTLGELQKIVNMLPHIPLDADGKKLIPHTLTDNRGERYICSSDVADVHAEDTCTTSAVTSFRFAYRWLMVFELAIRKSEAWKDFQAHGKI